MAKPTAKVLDLWLVSDGVDYLRGEMLKKYLLKSMGASGSDIDTFEGRGAINFLALDSRRVGEEGKEADPASVVCLRAVEGRLEIPSLDGSPRHDFVQRVSASGKKWVILTDPDGTPHLLLNTDGLLRALFSEKSVDPHDYCVKPIIANDTDENLERALMKLDPAKEGPTERGIILFWDTEKRIIAHADVPGRLFEGVISSPPRPWAISVK